MNRFNKCLAATFLSATMFFAGAAQAISIQQFDKMGPAGDRYVADLVETAEKALTDAGRSNDAARVSKLFTTNAPNSKESIGMQQFYMTLALARVHDAKHGEQSDVADVLALSLENNDGARLPDNFFKLADNIKPGSSPPKAKEKKEKKN
jgi:hypothetical protein